MKKKVFIAGEHCSAEYNGYTHGALFEGQRVAADVMNKKDSLKKD